MKFKLILIAKMDDSEASNAVNIVVSPTAQTDGFPNTSQGAIDVIVQKLSEIPGFSIS